MTNDQIQRVLAMAGSLNASDTRGVERFVGAATALLTALAMPGGAISIADDAAWELIESECKAYSDDPNECTWYQVHNTELRLDLEDEPDIYQHVSNAVTYLTARGLLVVHPEHQTMVTRVCPHHANQA